MSKKIKKGRVFEVRRNPDGLWDVVDVATGTVVAELYLTREIAESQARRLTTLAKTEKNKENNYGRKSGNQNSAFGS